MSKLSSHLRIYLTLYGLTILVATLSLSINIKTVPINTSIQSLNKQLRQLKEENQMLLQQLLHTTQLHQVEKKAIEDYNMRPPRKIRYVRVTKGDSH